jgi:hypothetical protein
LVSVLLLLLLLPGHRLLCGEHTCWHLPAHRATASPGRCSSRIRRCKDDLQRQVSR